ACRNIDAIVVLPAAWATIQQVELLSSDSGSKRACRQVPPLCGQPQTESPKVGPISPPQSARFLAQSKKQYQPSVRYPDGRPLETASQKIDGTSHPDTHWHSQGAVMHSHPFLGLGAAKSD